MNQLKTIGFYCPLTEKTYKTLQEKQTALKQLKKALNDSFN